MDAAPLAYVARAGDPPVIDGKGDDAAWQTSVAIPDFIAPDSNRPLQEKTEVRLLWDAGKLYVFARLEESILSTASQQQHEIRANAKERDDNVIQDDSLLLILHPEGSDAAFEFGINTLGVLADAKSAPADPWRTRDFSWNAKVESAVSLDDGFWIVEMAIPWSELGVAPPAEGTQWKAVLARHAAARRESGSWNPSHGGIHAPESWGTLIFGAPAIGMSMTAPVSRLEAGSNQFQLALTPQTGEEGGLIIATKITPEQNDARPIRTRQTARFQNAKPATLRHEFEAPSSGGMVRYAWSVLNAATLEPLYQSPEMTMEVLSSNVTLRLSTSAAWRLLVNDAPLASGEKAEDEAIRIPLRTGVNVLALEAQSGKARLRLDSPDLGNAPIRWKMRPAQDSGRDADDSQWLAAPENETGEIGENGSPLVFLHTILLQNTRIFPAPMPALYIAGGGVQPVTFTAFGIPGKVLKDWKIFLELPEPVEAVAATGYYGGSDGKPRFSLRSDKGRRYVIEADAPIQERRSGSPVLSLFDVALRQTQAPVKTNDETHTMRHYSRANDDTVSELAQNTSIRLLPPLRGVQPKRLAWQIWANFFSAIDNPEMRRAIAETARVAGFNDLVGASGEQARPFSLHSTSLINFKPYSLNLTSWLRKHPEARLINHEGRPDDTLMCTTVLLDNGWSEAGVPLLKEWQATRQVDTINYDYEYSPFAGPHSCYCPRCLEAFLSAAGLADAALNAGVIKESHAAAWIDFMARRVANVFLLMKNAVHELPGDVKFEIYSGYQTPGNTARYGVDWRYVGELQAADRAGVGYGRPIPAIEETVTALRGIPAMFGELITPYMKEPLDFSRPANPLTKANLLRRFIDATGGSLVYHTQNMDGRSWLAAAEISRLVAEFEDLFGTQQAETVLGQPEAEVALLKGDAVSLLCVMNPGRTEKNYSFGLPAKWNGATEFYSGRKIPSGERIQITLPPGDVAAFHTNHK